MKFKGIILIALFGLLLFSLESAAHGVNINTANIAIRNNTHLILRLHYRSLNLLNRLNPQQKFPLAVWANMPESELGKHYEKIKNLFEAQLSIKIDNHPIESLRIRFLPLEKFRSKIRDHFMQQVIAKENQAAQKKPQHRHEELKQLIRIEGFLPKGHTQGVLMVDFPAELGEVMVTLTKPVSQTLRADSNGIQYRQRVY